MKNESQLVDSFYYGTTTDGKIAQNVAEVRVILILMVLTFAVIGWLFKQKGGR